ncbi:MAG: calcium/sodium antiporter [Phycisphaerales bacterium]
MPIVMFVVGLAVLLVGADLLIRGAVSLAKALGIPTLIIGLTVVAFGTSAPELAAGITAVLADKGDINIGNVVGSNIANVGLILGFTAVIYPVVCHVRAIRLEVPIMIGVGVLGYVLMVHEAQLTRIDASILLAGLVGYISLILILAKRDRAKAARHAAEIREQHEQQIRDAVDTQPDESGTRPAHIDDESESEYDPRTDSIDLDLTDPLAIDAVGYPLPVCIVFVVLGLAGLIFGSDWMVHGAVKIAGEFGVPESVIALTMVAFGTSVPELAAAFMAARKHEPDLVIGNIVGSNIFNILCVLGVTAFVAPINTPESVFGRDGPMMILLSALMLPLMIRKGRVGRGEGFILLALYVGYIIATILM